MSQAYEQIRAELTDLLGFVRAVFPAEQTRHVEDFIASNEYQLALEWVLDGLADLEAPIPPEAASLARTIASRLDVLDVIAARLARLRLGDLR